MHRDWVSQNVDGVVKAKQIEYKGYVIDLLDGLKVQL